MILEKDATVGHVFISNKCVFALLPVDFGKSFTRIFLVCHTNRKFQVLAQKGNKSLLLKCVGHVFQPNYFQSYANTSYGLFTRWMYEINQPDLGQFLPPNHVSSRNTLRTSKRMLTFFFMYSKYLLRTCTDRLYVQA